MSFSSKIKDEIIGSNLKNFCCRRSLLHGVLAAKGEVADGCIIISVENEEIGKFVSALIKEFFGRDAYIGNSIKGGRRKILSFKSQSCEKFLIDFISGSGAPYIDKCPSCKSAFLKGIFLSSGRISDPQKQYCLELSLGKNINCITSFFDENGIYLKMRERGNEKILYTRSSGQIEDFFALAEIHSATFNVINTKIQKDFLNNANRARNFAAVNIQKAVNIGYEQAEVLKELEKRNLLWKLPDELRRTAKLRIEYPDLSIMQLALRSVPPLTKSGMVHRLSKIMKLAKELLCE